MKCYALVLPGLEKICRQEIKELLHTTATGSAGFVEFKVDQKYLPRYASRAQSVRRILIALGKYKEIDSFQCDPALNWSDFFPASFSFKIDVENVPGQDNRFSIAKIVAGRMFPFLEQKKFTPRLEMKKPDFLMVVYFTGKEYAIGIDFCGEIDSRHYRVFTHQASLKGDLAYAIVRSSGLVPGEKIVVGFVKDGTVAIEAALFSNGLPVQKASSFAKFPLYASLPVAAPGTASTIVYGFDESSQNIIAAQKNSLLAGTKQYLQLRGHSLEELDIAVPEHGGDHLIFHLTSKDEGKINELYRQVLYILKPKGTLLIFSTSLIDLPIPRQFCLKKKAFFQKGDSKYHLWLLTRK